MEGHDIQIDQESIDNVACLLKNIYLTAAKKSGMVKTYGNYKPCKSGRKRKPWFDANCARLRAQYFHLKNLRKIDKSDSIEKEYTKVKKMYKKRLFVQLKTTLIYKFTVN